MLSQIRVDNPLAGKIFGEIFAELKNKLNVLAIGVCKQEKGGKRTIYKLPPDNLKVECDDFLIVIMSGKETGPIKDLFKTREGA